MYNYKTHILVDVEERLAEYAARKDDLIARW